MRARAERHRRGESYDLTDARAGRPGGGVVSAVLLFLGAMIESSATILWQRPSPRAMGCLVIGAWGFAGNAVRESRADPHSQPGDTGVVHGTFMRRE